MEGTISPEMERSVRGVSFAESNNKNTLLQEVEKRHEQGVYITKKRCAELDGAVAEGVQKFRTPSGNTISRKL